MKKDVIYIDTEDDITSIIDKVKHASAPIVALVPPKRVGVLQSTVNLKLLQRAANSAEKRIVLITSDPALTALAGGLALPIAKNLQSKPEIAELTALDSDDGGIINGEDIDYAPSVDKSTDGEEKADQKIDTATTTALASVALEDEVKPPKARGAGTKIPNFDLFRKKLFIFSSLGVLFVAFFVWALVFAPHAAIAITARTNAVNISKTLQLTPNAQLDASQGVLPVASRQVKKTVSADFTPTGKKDVGERAAGVVKISTDSISMLGKTVPAGTELTATNDLVYTTNTALTFTDSNASGANVGVTAVATGSKYNGATGSVDGLPNKIDGAFIAPTTGGTDKTITVVSADDITKATAQLQNQDANAVRGELVKQFGSDEIVIKEAYIVESSNPLSTPAVDQEATTAKISVETTYTLLAVKRNDLKAVYDTFLQAQLKGDTSQKVYKSGDEATQFSIFQKVEGGYSIRAIADAQVGPNIDSSKVASESRGKQAGEVSQSLELIQGVSNVDVKFSPFWVNRVPNDTSHITVTFVLKND